MSQEQGTTDRSWVWPVTAFACAAIISIGIYCGLKDNGPSRPVAPIGVYSSTNQSVREDIEQATVYVTRTGECYHRGNCGALRSRIPMSLNDAKQRYRPCSRCSPPH